MASIEFDAAEVRVATPAGERTLLHRLDLTLSERRVGLIGSNGSGKSTLARLINGLIVPTTGAVRVDGLDTRGDGPAVRRRVGFCFTDPAAQLVMPTPAEDLGLSLRRAISNKADRRTRALEILGEIGLLDRADVSVHALSGGQRQLLALAGVLAVEPSIVVADEPTTLLDRRNTRLVADRLFGLDQQLILVTHDLDLAARCDRVLVIEDATVIADDSGPAAVAAYLARVDA